jgi:hypothetical protein
MKPCFVSPKIETKQGVGSHLMNEIRGEWGVEMMNHSLVPLIFGFQKITAIPSLLKQGGSQGDETWFEGLKSIEFQE